MTPLFYDEVFLFFDCSLKYFEIATHSVQDRSQLRQLISDGFARNHEKCISFFLCRHMIERTLTKFSLSPSLNMFLRWLLVSMFKR